MKIKFFDISFRTAYAQAKELALAQRQVPLVTAGSLRTEERSGQPFVYRYRYHANGKRITEYLGPKQDPETAAKVQQATAEIQEAAAIGDYSRNLRKVGFHSTENSALITIAALFNAGLFGKGGVLVGTHAFGAILNELGIADTLIAMTEDVDVAKAEPIQIAALPKGGFLKLLTGTGLPFHEVPQLKPGAPATSFKVRGRNLKVDLLVPSKGEPYKPVAVPELGVHATGLPHLQFLLDEPTQSILLGRERIVPITVPHAGRFCVHKLALYSLRTGDNPKSQKDVAQAALLAAAIAEEKDYLLADAIKDMDKALRTKAKAGAKRAIELLQDEHPEAASLLEELA